MTAPTATDKLRALQSEYAQRLPQRALELHDRTTTLANCWDAPAALELRRMAHNLAGSGASFGFPEVSAAARTLERALDAALATALPDASGSADIQRAVEQLVATIGAIRPD